MWICKNLIFFLYISVYIKFHFCVIKLHFTFFCLCPYSFYIPDLDFYQNEEYNLNEGVSFLCIDIMVKLKYVLFIFSKL